AGAEHELLGLQCRAETGRNGVCIDVEQRAFVVRRYRAHDGHQAVVEPLLQDSGIDEIDVADEAVIDDLPLDLHGRTLVCAHETGIHDAHDARVDVEYAADAQALRVDESVHHHARHYHQRLVGDAPAGNEPRLDAERFLYLRELRPAA